MIMKRMTAPPARQCVGCREMKDKNELLRILRNQEGKILLDPTGKMNGRGAYLCRDKACLLKAKKNRGLERSLRQSIPETVYVSLEKELEKLG